MEIVDKINDDSIQVLEKTIRLNSQVGEGTNSAIVKDTISIDSDENLAEILKADIRLTNKDIKLSYNKILAKAEAEIKVIYLTESGKIKSQVSQIPVVGFVDIQNVQEENICDVIYEPKNIVIKPNSSDEHSIYVEVEIQISCMAYEEKEVNLISDLYSLTDKIVMNADKIKAISSKSQRKDNCEVRERVKIPEINSNNLIDVDVIPNIIKKTNSNTKIMYEGELILNFIYENSSTFGVNTKSLNVPFEFTIDNFADNENTETDSEIEILNSNFDIQSDGDIACSVDLEFNTNSYKNEEINIINELDVEPDSDLEDYSVIIYIVKKGDTLWEIAKKYKSTVDDIVRTNGIENSNRIDIGDKIYIPRYVKKYASA